MEEVTESVALSGPPFLYVTSASRHETLSPKLPVDVFDNLANVMTRECGNVQSMIVISHGLRKASLVGLDDRAHQGHDSHGGTLSTLVHEACMYASCIAATTSADQ